MQWKYYFLSKLRVFFSTGDYVGLEMTGVPNTALILFSFLVITFSFCTKQYNGSHTNILSVLFYIIKYNLS